jgi:hypothetical protein
MMEMDRLDTISRARPRYGVLDALWIYEIDSITISSM